LSISANELTSTTVVGARAEPFANFAMIGGEENIGTRSPRRKAIHDSVGSDLITGSPKHPGLFAPIDVFCNDYTVVDGLALR
jgi:hypothetical protein